MRVWFYQYRQYIQPDGGRYLHGARLAVADHGGPSDVDGLRERKRLVQLVLGEVLQAALVGLFVLILTKREEE